MKSLAPIVLALGFTVLSCSSTQELKEDVKPGLATCLKESQEQLKIEWGTLDNYDRQEGLGYKLTAEREVLAVQHFINTERTLRPALRVLTNDEYCELAKEVNAIFLKVQALHSPGEKGRFIRYTNAPSGVYLRAVWNPELETFQSRDMRALYDKLMQLIPTEESGTNN